MAESIIPHLANKWTLVWEKGSETSRSAGTISVDLSGYSWIRIEFIQQTGSSYNYGIYQEYPVGGVTNVGSGSNYTFNSSFRSTSTGNPNVCNRSVTAVTTSGVTISAGMYKNSSGTTASTSNNSYVIPCRIWAL